MTTGAAQTLWRSYQTLPGKRIAVCGSGPLNVQVALELAKGGAEIVYLAERAPAAITKPLTALAMAAADPKLTLQGLNMLAGLRQHGIKVRNNSELRKVVQDGDGLAATFTASGGEETVHVDVLCMNAGFEPQNEILRLLGASMQYDAAMGHLRCEKNTRMETSVSGLYAIGDCTGLGGAPAARIEGEIAALMPLPQPAMVSQATCPASAARWPSIGNSKPSFGRFTTSRSAIQRHYRTRPQSAAARN